MAHLDTARQQKPGSARRRITAALLALVLVMSLSFFAYAWLIQKERDVTNQVFLTDLDIACDLYFVQGIGSDNQLTLADLEDKTPYVKPDKDSMITVSFDKNDANYIGNLRLAVKVTGGSPAYVRIKILEQWTVDDTFIPSTLTPYTVPKTQQEIFGVEKENWLTSLFPSWQQENNLNITDTDYPDGAWFDNRKSDFCYYYRVPVYPFQQGTAVSMLLINGITDDNFSTMMNTNEKTQLKLILEAEAVQPNRYREFFNIEKLPWEEETGGSSAG